MSLDGDGHWHLVAKTSDVTPSVPKRVTVGKLAIGIYQVNDAYYALDEICTHQFALLSRGACADGIVECPRHQGRFEIATGKALGPFTEKDVGTYKVRREGDDIYVEIPPPPEGPPRIPS